MGSRPTADGAQRTGARPSSLTKPEARPSPPEGLPHRPNSLDSLVEVLLPDPDDEPPPEPDEPEEDDGDEEEGGWPVSSKNSPLLTSCSSLGADVVSGDVELASLPAEPVWACSVERCLLVFTFGVSVVSCVPVASETGGAVVEAGWTGRDLGASAECARRAPSR